MEGNMNRGISVYLDKKRKLHEEELLGAPLPNHLYWVQKKLKSNLFASQFESDQESEKDSNSFGGNTDHTESSSYDYSNFLPKEHECFGPSSSSANWVGTSSEIDMCTSESISTENPNSSKSQSMSISEEVNGRCLNPPDDDYEDLLLEFERYKTDGFEHCQDLDNLLYSNGLAPGSYNYVHSPGTLPVAQDNQQGIAKKLTIDKEFEQYFSSLML